MQTGSAVDWFYMDSPATWYCRKLRGGGYYFCSQSHTVSSLEPDATSLPSGEKATLWAVPLPREPENFRRFDDKTSSPDLSESLPSAYFILLSTSSFCGRGGCWYGVDWVRSEVRRASVVWQDEGMCYCRCHFRHCQFSSLSAEGLKGADRMSKSKASWPSCSLSRVQRECILLRL